MLAHRSRAIFRTLFRLLIEETRIYRFLKYRRQFPGLGASASADLQIFGKLRYEPGTSIGQGTSLLIETSGCVSLGKEVFLGRDVEISTDDNLHIGSRSSIQNFSVVVGRVAIGADCLISYGVMITSGRHYFRLRPNWLIRDQDEFARNTPELRNEHHQAISIEDDCWIGAHAVLTPGVSVGRGSIIGANAVVTSNIPPYSVAVGAPARVTGKRLQFLPPRQIDSARLDDIPYFYAGFDLAQSHSDSSSAQDGFIATGKFCLALAHRNGQKVRLRIRSLAGPAVVLHGSVEISIPEHWSEISFTTSSEMGERLWFEIIPTTNNPKPAVAITTAAIDVAG